MKLLRKAIKYFRPIIVKIVVLLKEQELIVKLAVEVIKTTVSYLEGKSKLLQGGIA